MRVYRLQTYDLPDVGDHLIHFTGRIGRRINVDPAIEAMPAQERLLHILVDGVVRGFETFGAEAPVVCFTESVKASVMRLIRDGRYEPCGIGFSKQHVFDRKGGPALYVRGDEWSTATAVLPQPLRCRLVRFWPGAQADPGEYLPNHLLTASEWLHEREWRVPTELRFDWQDVKFLIVPDPRWQEFYASWIESWAGAEYATVFAAIPAIVMDQAGNLLREEAGIWV
jgi:hypothetical protein